MESGSHDPRPASPAPIAGKPGLSLSALQRRRVLLRGVGKGSAVIAAAVPMQTFAANILKTQGPVERLCSVSGVGSMLPSAAPRAMGVCSGRTASFWHTAADSAWPMPKTTTFNDIFADGNTNTFAQWMTGNVSERQTWARAYLNAKAGYPNTFPYSPTEVVSMFKGSATQKAAALNFFTNFI